jgi:hypothetical protein
VVFPPLVTVRVIPETTARCTIAERGAVGAESGDGARKSEKVVVTQPVSQGPASVGTRLLAQDFDSSKDGRAILRYQLKRVG